MYIFKKYFKKLEKHLWRGLFCESCEIHTTDYLMWNTTKVLYYKFDEGVIYNTKIWKSTELLKENLRFKQLQLNYISNQKKQTKRTTKISNKL